MIFFFALTVAAYSIYHATTGNKSSFAGYTIGMLWSFFVIFITFYFSGEKGVSLELYKGVYTMSIILTMSFCVIRILDDKTNGIGKVEALGFGIGFFIVWRGIQLHISPFSIGTLFFSMTCNFCWVVSDKVRTIEVLMDEYRRITGRHIPTSRTVQRSKVHNHQDQ